MIRSLRARLFAGTTLASAVIMAVLALAIDASVHRTLMEQFDNSLAANAHAIAAMVEQGNEKVHLDPDALLIPAFQPGRHPAYFEVWVGGEVIARSPSLRGAELAGAPSRAMRDAVAIGTYTIVPALLPESQSGRQLTMSFHPTPEPGEDEEPRPLSHPVVNAALTVAQDTEELRQTLSHLRWLTVGLCAAASLLSGMALLWVVSRATRPVRRLAEQIGGLRETDLSLAVHARDMPAELLPVVERLNGLLARLDAAFNRERAFTADVAHELRTPLAGLLATLEVCRSRARDAAGYEVAIDKSLAMLAQMQSLVENLLLLARAEGGQLTLRRAEVDVASLVRECWGLFEGRAQGRSVTVQLNLPVPCVVECDGEILRLVINNLLDNAVSYVDEGGRIAIAIRQEAAVVGVRISNTGSALTEADLKRVFERFWRKESARSQTGLHAGLGLSLCRRLMVLQGGELRVDLTGDEGAAAGRLFCADAMVRRKSAG